MVNRRAAVNAAPATQENRRIVFDCAVAYRTVAVNPAVAPVVVAYGTIGNCRSIPTPDPAGTHRSIIICDDAVCDYGAAIGTVNRSCKVANGFTDCAVSNRWATVTLAAYIAAKSFTGAMGPVVCYHTIGNYRAGVLAEYPATGRHRHIPQDYFVGRAEFCDCAAGEDRIRAFPSMKRKSSMHLRTVPRPFPTLGVGSLSVYYCGSDDAGIIWVDASDGYGFTLEVDITASQPDISAGLDFDCIAIVCIVNSGLDVVEIGWRAIVIDGDRPCLTGERWQ